MKKSLLLLATTALVVSCASDSVRNDVAADEIPIGFVPSYMEKVTRANAGEMMISPTNTFNMTDNTFEVWGWKTSPTTTQIFNAQDVQYSGTTATETTTGWHYSPLKYWDRTAAYEFYAAAPHNVFTLDANKKFTITLASDKTFQVLEDMAGASKTKLAYNTDNSVTGTAGTAIDYLIAGKVTCAAGAANQGNASDKDVEFAFSHILSKLNIKVLTTDAFNHTTSTTPAYPRIELTDLKISLNGMATVFTQKTSGELTPAQNNGDTWATPITTAIENVCFDVDGTKVANSLLLSTTPQYIASYFVAPTPTGATPGKATVKVTAEYDIIYSDVTDHCISPETTVESLEYFGQNTLNVLNITISPQAILFDVQTVNGFDPDINGDGVVDEHDEFNQEVK